MKLLGSLSVMRTKSKSMAIDSELKIINCQVDFDFDFDVIGNGCTYICIGARSFDAPVKYYNVFLKGK